MNDARTFALALMHAQRHCTVATVGEDGAPQSALVAFSEAHDCSVVFGTFDDSRKFANIHRDPHVALTISDDNRSVQIEGIARVMSGPEADACRKRHAAKNPSSEKYATDPRQRYILVEPTWLRYTDYTENEEIVLESRF